MNYYNHKQELAKKYKDYSRDDLLWLLALYSYQRATFSGTMKEYMDVYLVKNKEVKRLIEGSKNPAVELRFTRLKRFGVSGATLYTATVNGVGVLLKKYRFWGDEENIGEWNGNVYENLVYKYFFDYLTTNYITPNIPFYYASSIENQRSYLYIELMDGQELKGYLGKHDVISTEFWRSVLFQILYTLLSFQQINLRHNDLHFDNIYIDTEITGNIKYYIDADTFYLVPLDGAGLVKIFDMDDASVDCTAPQLPKLQDLYTNFTKELNSVIVGPSSACDNTKLNDFYQNFGMVPRGKSLFDVFVVFCVAVFEEKNFDAETRLFINRVFTNEELQEEHKFKCRTTEINENLDFYPSIEMILADKYFEPYRNKVGDTSNVYRLPNLT